MVFGWTETVWLHWALSLELTAPAGLWSRCARGEETTEPRLPVQDQGERAARLEAGVGQDVGRLGRAGQGDRAGERQGGGAEQCEEAMSGTSEGWVCARDLPEGMGVFGSAVRECREVRNQVGMDQSRCQDDCAGLVQTGERG